MLIVGFGLMFAAFTVLILWNVYLGCRSLWRQRQALNRRQISKQHGGKQHSGKS